jgi:HTH-type transcriptional regulator/antitoxin HigA
LIRQFPLRPIDSEAELDRATAVMNALLDRDNLHSAETDYLEVLSQLVERYEDSHHAISTTDLTDGEMLAHLIEAKAVTQAAVARDAGVAESTLSQVRWGRRRLTRSQNGKLAKYFNVSPAVFVS